MSEVAAAQLPVISLKGKAILPAVLSIIPLETAEKFQVIAYEQTSDELHLAVVYPEQLKQGFFLALKQIGIKIGREIKLFRTDPASFKDVIIQYRKTAKGVEPPKPPALPSMPTSDAPVGMPTQKINVVAPSTPETRNISLPKQELTPSKESTDNWPPESPRPPLFELGKLVAYNYLKRIPLEFAKKHHILSVDFLPPNTYWFVADHMNKAALREVVEYIEETNKIKAHIQLIDDKEFADLLKYYEVLAEQERDKEIQETDKKALETKKEEEAELDRKVAQLNSPVQEEIVNMRVAEGVITPQVQAKILTTEEERGGIGGFFQKVAQNFAANEVEKTENDVPVVDVPLPAPTTAPVTKPAAQPTTPAAPTTKPAAPVAKEDEDIGKLLENHIGTIDELRGIVKLGMIPKIVAAVVSFAIHEKASDVHLEAFEDEVRVRYRVDGQLMDIIKLPPDLHNSLVSRIKILAKLRLDENRVPQDGRFEVRFGDDLEIDVRVSAMPTVHGEKVVLRILDKSRGVTSLEKLGIEGMAYDNLTQAIQKPYGICLATGPTGSGKSTSLYAILHRIATPNVNVVTLEDPVEYEMKGVNQSQIRPKIGYSFAEGLRSILRQDPNIIMVGEIRDGETANMATQAALTGHLVLSSLHTNDASGAIPRLTNMGIEPFLITSSLNMAMAQRLVRRICPDCKKEINLPSGIRTQLERDVNEIATLNPLDAKRIKQPITFYQGTGCATCNGKGYLGRVGIYEVLGMSDAIADLTIARASAIDIQNQARKEGMLTLYQDGLLKAVNGVTTIDEVLREATNK